MLISQSRELGTIELPYYNGELSMKPFNLNDISSLPQKFQNTVEQMIKHLPNKIGEAYLTVHGKFLKKSKTLRRGGAHIDGNYIKEVSSWGSGGGWKIDENGPQLSSKDHVLSYENTKGGMLIASNHSACKGWNGVFDDKAGNGGDCSHLKLDGGFMLKSNTIYYGNSQFIHESLPVTEDVFRIMYRITLPIDHKFIDNE